MTSVPNERPHEISLAEQRAAWHETWALLFKRRAERLARLAAERPEALEEADEHAEREAER